MLLTHSTKTEQADEEVLSEAYIGKHNPYDPPDTYAIVCKGMPLPMADMFAAVVLFLTGGDIEEELFIRFDHMQVKPNETKEDRDAEIAERVGNVKHRLQILHNAFATSMELLTACDIAPETEVAREVLAFLNADRQRQWSQRAPIGDMLTDLHSCDRQVNI